jgi:hypothetical protein
MLIVVTYPALPLPTTGPEPGKTAIFPDTTRPLLLHCLGACIPAGAHIPSGLRLVNPFFKAAIQGIQFTDPKGI